jgi:Rrf2 family protein
MRLSKKGEYALRAMIALARTPSNSITIAQIAAAQGIPKKFLEQILLALKASNLVTSRAGPKGGYELAQPPAALTLRRILEAVEEPMSQEEGRKARRNGGSGTSPIEDLMHDVRLYVRTRLDGVTLGEIAAEDLSARQLEELMWHI